MDWSTKSSTSTTDELEVIFLLLFQYAGDPFSMLLMKSGGPFDVMITCIPTI